MVQDEKHLLRMADGRIKSPETFMRGIVGSAAALFSNYSFKKGRSAVCQTHSLSAILFLTFSYFKLIFRKTATENE